MRYCRLREERRKQALSYHPSALSFFVLGAHDSDLETGAGDITVYIASDVAINVRASVDMPIFQLTVGQGRSRLRCLWFNATYLQDKFIPGQMIALYGKVEADQRTGELQILQPQFEILGDPSDGENPEKKAVESLEIGRIVPIYEGTGRLTSKWFRRIIRTALENLSPDLPEPIPAPVRAHLGLISPRAALWNVHWPEPGESLADLQSSRTAAHIRMIFEELFFVELGLELKRRQQKAQTGIAFGLDDKVRAAIKKILPFHPTVAQKKVLKEIAADMIAELSTTSKVLKEPRISFPTNTPQLIRPVLGATSCFYMKVRIVRS